jgi:hypothetical protein
VNQVRGSVDSDANNNDDDYDDEDEEEGLTRATMPPRRCLPDSPFPPEKETQH